jgi:DnaJ-class molecular chaperone
VDKLDAQVLLRINLPFTKKDILTAFRKYVFEHHQDRSGIQVDMDVACKAKEILMSHCVSESRTSEMTTCGIPLETLGEGLPYPKTGSECDRCQGKGYTSTVVQPTSTCPDCMGFVYSFTRCRFCKRCKGTGVIRHVRGGNTVHNLCFRCNGSGELEVWNPLIPRGAIL